MDYEEKLLLLRSIPLLKRLPERQLTGLAEVLKPRELAADELLFEEGAFGTSLYFVAKGRVRVSQRLAAGGWRDLAVLGPGQFFGEMALTDDVPRSATATGDGPCLLFELFKGDLARWTESNPQQAVQFFAEMLAGQSRRLRRATMESTLHLDLAGRPWDASASEGELLSGLLQVVLAHSRSDWSVAAYLGAAPAKLAASRGQLEFAAEAPPMAAGRGSAWLDDRTFQAALPGAEAPLGQLLFRCAGEVPAAERDDLEQTMASAARSVAAVFQLVRRN